MNKSVLVTEIQTHTHARTHPTPSAVTQVTRASVPSKHTMKSVLHMLA